jgi:hypothetical protein
MPDITITILDSDLTVTALTSEVVVAALDEALVEMVTSPVTIDGPAGPTGERGDRGPQGPQGLDGSFTEPELPNLLLLFENGLV